MSADLTEPEEMPREALEDEVEAKRERIESLEDEAEARRERIESLEDEAEAKRERIESLEEKVQRIAAVQTRMINEVNEDVNGDTDSGTTVDDPSYIKHGGDAVKNLLDVRDRVETVETMANRHESQVQSEQSLTGDRQVTNWQKVVDYAVNVDGKVERNTIPGKWVMLYKDDISSATGLSERRARQLMDEWTPGGPHEKRGTRLRPYRPPTESNRGNAKQKAVKLDLSVWGKDD